MFLLALLTFCIYNYLPITKLFKLAILEQYRSFTTCIFNLHISIAVAKWMNRLFTAMEVASSNPFYFFIYLFIDTIV